ncbi:UNVERIFIED_CONTAM: hypothetical protein FKN15_026456 [Acipenser sinensis]
MGRKSCRKQQKRQQQQQQLPPGDVCPIYIVDEWCPGCGEFGHTVAICPTQYQGEEWTAQASQDQVPQRRPQKQEIPVAATKQESRWDAEGPASPGVVEGPASPGVATSSAMRQETLWPEPHGGELPAMKKGEEGQETSSPCSSFAAGNWVAGAPRRGTAGHKEGGGGQETSSPSRTFAA